MDAFLVIASKRDIRDYAQTPIREDVRRRILDAGRLAGSARNKQDWEFVLVEDARQALAQTVYAPQNVSTAELAVAIVGGAGAFDVGRAAQNMMLAAWNDGVASCPNGIADSQTAARICGGDAKIVLSFGYPARTRAASARSADEWSARANRRPLDQLVRRV